MAMNPRIELLIGGPLDDPQYSQIAALVRNPRAREAPDLDYKGFLYHEKPSKKSQKEPQEDPQKEPLWRSELAKDVCAMANSMGGVIILGMHENDGVPSAVNPRPFGDAEHREYMEAISERVDPRLEISVRFAEKPDDPSVGFVVIEVPRSLRGPHGALGIGRDAKDGYMRFPIRNGSGTDFLTPAEVFEARTRNQASLSARRSGSDQLIREILRVGLQDEEDWPRLVVSLTPEIGGRMELRNRSLEAFRQELRTEPLWLAEPGHTFDEVSPRAHGLEARMYTKAEREIRSRLGSDGAGVIEYQLRTHKTTEADLFGPYPPPFTLSPGELCGMVLSALGLLARHAIHGTGTRGGCEVHAWVLSGAAAMPGITLPPAMTAPDIELMGLGNRGSASHAGASAETALEYLAAPGAPLVRVADELLSQIAHAFGDGESWYTTADGALVRDQRTPFFPSGPLYRWAKKSGVDVVDWRDVR